MRGRSLGVFDHFLMDYCRCVPVKFVLEFFRYFFLCFPKGGEMYKVRWYVENFIIRVVFIFWSALGVGAGGGQLPGV